jgi:nucleoside-diphosphate-sugar epimerase
MNLVRRDTFALQGVDHFLHHRWGTSQQHIHIQVAGKIAVENRTEVNMGGCWNIMSSAVRHGIRRVINTGPHFTIDGRSYETFDFAISPEGPPQPGTQLYALTKSLGHEICRIFTEHHEIYVLNYLVYNFRSAVGSRTLIKIKSELTYLTIELRLA